MGIEGVEAQTDGGLCIKVPDPLAQTTPNKSLTWPRSYYVLPLEVISRFVVLFVRALFFVVFGIHLIVGQTQDPANRERRHYKGI
jgi:hypothetical protein